MRLFGVLRESPALHVYLMQAVGFLYLAYRFASRDYSVYGLLPDEAFAYPRNYQTELWPLPPLHFTTLQFLYDFLPRPSVEVIRGMQITVVGASLLGFLGIFPRLAAALAFLLAAHVTGFAQSSNADVDGGTMALCLMLILALSPRSNFYGWKRFDLHARSTDHHWPVFLLFLVVGSYYTFSGINKVVEIGPEWPFTLHLEHLAEVGIEQTLFRSDRFRIAPVSAAHLSPAMSVFGGIASLIGETGFILILFLPRYRLFFAASMVAMHALVYAMQGINFLGSSAVILLCVDWNALVRPVTVLYDSDCGFCEQSIRRVRALDWFRRIRPRTILESGELPVDQERLRHEMGAVDDAGVVTYGADAFDEVFVRTPLLWPLALLLRVPGVIFVARPVYRAVAKHRRHATCALPKP